MAIEDDYSAVLVMDGLVPAIQEFASLKRDLVADGRPNQARLVQGAFSDFVADAKKLAAEIAHRAEQLIKEYEVETRVRGSGGQGEPLNPHVGLSTPIPDLPGSVAINNEPELYNNVPWWWTNEEGYNGLVGLEIGESPHGDGGGEKGFFRPSGTRPGAGGGADTSFVPSSRGGPGEIHNPIPAREFVLRGYKDAAAEWHTGVRALESAAAAKILAIMAGVPA